MLALFISCAPAFGQSAQTLSAPARLALEQNDFAGAERLSAAVLLASPEDWSSLSVHAMALSRQGKYRSALGDLDNLVAHFPADSSYSLRKAQILAWSGKLRSAESAYALLAQKYPGDMDALTGLGLVRFWMGDFASALTTFEKVLQKEPSNSLAFNSYIKAMNGEGLFTEAFAKALQQDQKTGRADPELGLTLASLALSLAGEQEFAQWTTRPSKDEDLIRRQHKVRAQRFAAQGRHENAVAEMKKITATRPRDFDALVDTADILALADQRAAARNFYEQARVIRPENAEPLLGLARLASREGLLSSSYSLYETAVRENQESIDGWLGMARVAGLLQDFSLAETALQGARQAAPRSAGAQAETLKLHLQLGNLAEFENSLKQWFAADPEAAFLWRQRALLAKHQDLDWTGLRSRLGSRPPEECAFILHLLLLSQPQKSAEDCLLCRQSNSPLQGEEFNRRKQTETARYLALLLHREEALQLVAGDESQTPIIQSLANGWRAYAAAPLAWHGLLTPDFDPQALTVWLAGHWQKRLRVMEVETGSPLLEEWLLQRAVWLDRWPSKTFTVEAAEDLFAIISSTLQTRQISMDQISEGWQASERTPPDESAYAAKMSQARWRQYRFDYTGALALLDELARQFPSATEPLQRKASILRASGRLLESSRVYERMIHSGFDTPQTRLEYAEELRLLHEPAQAASQYQTLRSRGFQEPSLFLGEAGLLAAENLPHKALETIESGLRLCPGDYSLLEFKAGLLRKADHHLELAEFISQYPGAGWIQPDLLAPAFPHLSVDVSQRILSSPAWVLGWQWIPFYRLPGLSLRVAQESAERALAEQSPAAALQIYERIMEMKIPDSDSWFAAARLCSFSKLPARSERAFAISLRLGVGRLDAETAQLIQNARKLSPSEAARKFSRLLEERPEERDFISGLVASYLRDGQISAAEKALQNLIDAAPEDPELRLLSAQARAAEGRIRQARSLDESVLRQDPLSFDARAARRSLDDADEFSFSAGSIRSFLHDTTGAGANLPDWEDTYLAAWWRRPHQQTLSLDFHSFRRFGESASQLDAGWSGSINRDWILRLEQGAALSGRFIPQWRASAGISHRLKGDFFAELDLSHLHFSDVAVWQAVPGVVWRWQPSISSFARIYLSESDFRGGGANRTLTWSAGSSWEFSRQSSVQVHYSIGGEDTSNLTRSLIGENGFQSAGMLLKLGWRHRFILEPSFSWETHARFDSFSTGLAFTYSY